MSHSIMPTRAMTVLMSVSLLALAGCETMDGFDGFAQGAAEADGAESLSIVERDIEKPEIFTQRDMALWDGRPSFGGVWVALPGNIQPERVSITNVDNGKAVVGALFKREEQNPGPPIRLSSDAAAALDVIPGQPTLVSVTVVRRETFANVPNTPADSVPADVETTTLAPLPASGTADTAALSTQLAAAIDTEASPTTETSSETATAAARPAQASATAAAGAVATASAVAATAEAAEPVKPRRTLLDFFRNRRSAEAPAAPQGEVISVVTPQGGAQPAALAGAAPQIATTTIAAAPVAASDPAQSRAPSSDLSKPFLQTGTFSSRANAEDQAKALDGAGVPAIIRAMTTNSGKTLYRVLAGPAFSSGQQREFTQTARRLGIQDAFPTAK